MRMRWRVPALAASYVGAVVGAGFASGTEVAAFLAVHGRAGYWASALSGVLFAMLGAIVLRRAVERGPGSYVPILKDFCGPWLGGVLDRLALLFLYVVLAVVVAGAGALGDLLFGWSAWLGSSALAVVLGLSALGGQRAFTWLNCIAAPLIVVVCAGAALRGLSNGHDMQAASSSGVPWPVASLLYVAYNFMLATAGLCAATDGTERPREAVAAGLLGGGILGVLCVAVTAAVLHVDGGPNQSLPLAAAFKTPLERFLAYPITLGLALWTTGGAAAVALGRRCAPRRPALGGALAVAVSVPLAWVGLVPLVAHAYPVLGYAGAPLVLGVLLAPLRAARRSSPP